MDVDEAAVSQQQLVLLNLVELMMMELEFVENLGVVVFVEDRMEVVDLVDLVEDIQNRDSLDNHFVVVELNFWNY